MTRPESITAGPFLDTAAVLRGWSDAKFDALRPDLTFDSERIFKAGDELAEALRAANPPAGAERATEPFDWNKAKPFRSSDEWYSGKPSNDETHARTAATVQWLMEHGGRFPDDPEPATPYGRCPTCGAPGCNRERRPNGDDHCTNGHKYPSRDAVAAPATPAVGEDAGADCECTCAAELAEKVRALLADVARLQKELDGATFREERYAEDAVGARLALEDARAEVARLTEERDNTTKALRRADSMLTAVRKIADDYHDVDVTGDPPREVACNPCANDILNVLEGRKP